LFKKRLLQISFCIALISALSLILPVTSFAYFGYATYSGGANSGTLQDNASFNKSSGTIYFKSNQSSNPLVPVPGGYINFGGTFTFDGVSIAKNIQTNGQADWYINTNDYSTGPHTLRANLSWTWSGISPPYYKSYTETQYFTINITDSSSVSTPAPKAKKTVKKRVTNKNHAKKCAKNKKFHVKHCKAVKGNKKKSKANAKYHKKACTKVITVKE